MQSCDFVMAIRQSDNSVIAELVSFQFPLERDNASLFLTRLFGADKVERVYPIKRPNGRFHHGFGWSDTVAARDIL